jgi:hypothetical protein
MPRRIVPESAFIEYFLIQIYTLGLFVGILTGDSGCCMTAVANDAASAE